MYEIQRYTDANAVGAASLLQVLADDRGSLRKLLVASSMSIYGEGAYTCASHGLVFPQLRPEAQLAMRGWEVRCPTCGNNLAAAPTGEGKPLFPTSIYAINKRDHEEMFLAVGRAYGIPSVALRFFNIYGSRQALSNPYTGVAAIFCSRLLNGQRPLIFEDGQQARDFIHVSDIVQGCLLAMNRAEADYQVFNLGTGRPLTVQQVAKALAAVLGRPGDVTITEKYRAGDIRHCYADVTRARELLGFEPRVRFEDGLDELVQWISTQDRVEDRSAVATAQLSARGLTR
jgi:dTDP-L-rhamnose 4-epimerase